jgi:hypothetical protein
LACAYSSDSLPAWIASVQATSDVAGSVGARSLLNEGHLWLSEDECGPSLGRESGSSRPLFRGRMETGGGSIDGLIESRNHGSSIRVRCRSACYRIRAAPFERSAANL